MKTTINIVMFFVYQTALLLSWSANTEDDLGGYKLYYGEYAYEFVIDVGNIVEFDISKCIAEGEYEACLTAYDFTKNESGYSEQLTFYTNGEGYSNCQSDFNLDGDVDGADAYTFKENFGRDDCMDNDISPCLGDYNCDGDVDGTDANTFKGSYGRSDCPDCGVTTCF